MLRQELVVVLTAYLSSQNTLYDCYAWIAGLSWDDPELLSDQKLKGYVGALELLSIESMENMRPEADFREEAALTVRAMSKGFQLEVSAAAESAETYWRPATDQSSIPSFLRVAMA